MIQTTLLISTLAVLDMTTAYWICLIFGGGLLVISSMSGGHGDANVDVGLDVHADFDADGALHADLPGHADAGFAEDAPSGAEAATSAVWLASWFSLRFVVFFVAVFGAVGVVLTHLTDTSRGTALGLALASGGAVGQGVHQLFRRLRRSSGNSATRPQDYVHKLARVTIATAHAKKGEVSLQVRDARRFVPAVTTRAGAAFEVGDEVVVVGYRAGIAEVVSRDEYEVLSRKEQGGLS